MERTDRFAGVEEGNMDDWFSAAMDGLDQLLEAAGQLKVANKYKTNYVPATMMWEAKEEAYKEVKNLLSLIAKKKSPHPETVWSWKE